MKTKYSLPLLLILLGIVSHIQWFTISSILTYSDWFYWPKLPVEQLWSGWGTWLGFWNAGAPNIQIPFLVFMSSWSFLAHVGLSYDQATKLTILIPIALLSFLSPYMLFRRLSGNDWIGFVVALFYGTTTYILVRQSVHLPIAFIYAVTPLIFWLFMRGLESWRSRDWLFFTLAYSLGVAYEVRIMFILSFILLAYAVAFNLSELRLHRTTLIIVAMAILGLNSYWLLPMLFGGLGSSVASVASRGLFGNSLFDLIHALTLSDSSWTGKLPDQTFTAQPVPWYLWVIPFLALFPFFVRQKLFSQERRHLVFFGIVALCGILLTKQSAGPFPDLYGWLYLHLPGFSLFREASKFYLLTAIGYAGLLYLSLVAALRFRGIKSKPILCIVFASLIMAVAVTNLFPLVTMRIGGVFVNRQIPSDYQKLESFINSQPGYFRTYWTPTYSRWSPFSLQHPEISAVSLLQGDWKLLTPTPQSTDYPIRKQLLDIFTQSDGPQLFKSAGIKYVIVPTQDVKNEDDFYAFYGKDRQYYIKELDRVGWLKRIDLGLSELVVYENQEYSAPISTSDQLAVTREGTSLDVIAKFLHDTGKKVQVFVSEATLGTPKLPSIYQLFNNDDPLTILKQSQKIIDTITSKSQKNATLYKNDSALDLRVEADMKSISVFTQSAQDISLNGALLAFPGSSERAGLVELPLEKDKDFFMVMDGMATLLRAGMVENFGPISKIHDAGIYRAGKNMVENGSFESGTWQDQVGDCDNHDQMGHISQSLNTSEKTAGNQSLELIATRHTACTSKEISVTPGSLSLFSLDYESPNTRQAGYYIRFNDQAKTYISDRLGATTKWQHVINSVKVPISATSAEIFLYSYESDGVTENTVRYDDIKFEKPELVTNIKLQKPSPHYSTQTISLISGLNQFEYQDPGNDYRNLIDNPSFEDGPWSPKISDCNNYDQNARISQEINSTSYTDGAKSLQIEATRHDACSSQTFGVKKSGTYTFGLDYQADQGTQVGYYLRFNNLTNSVVNGRFESSGSGWQHILKNIEVPSGASTATLSLYSYESNGRTKNIVRYDNVRFSKSSEINNTYFLETGSSLQLQGPEKLSFSSGNPTKKEIQLSKVSKPFMISLAESFHPGWKLYLRRRTDTRLCDEVGRHQAKEETTYKTYALKEGERYSTVARKFGVDYTMLLALNKVDQSTIATSGTVVVLPDSTSEASIATRRGEVIECAPRPHFMDPEDIGFLKQKPVFDDNHFKINGYANGWVVDPDFIKTHFGSEYYSQNTDGSINLNLVAYFRPQSYFYIGIGISGATLLGCMGYLGYALLRRKGRRPALIETTSKPKPDQGLKKRSRRTDLS